jgi:hypothetical protein
VREVHGGAFATCEVAPPRKKRKRDEGGAKKKVGVAPPGAPRLYTETAFLCAHPDCSDQRAGQSGFVDRVGQVEHVRGVHGGAFATCEVAPPRKQRKRDEGEKAGPPTKKQAEKEAYAIESGYHRPLAEQRQALDLGVPLVTKQYGKQMQVPPLPPLPPFCPVFCPVF